MFDCFRVEIVCGHDCQTTFSSFSGTKVGCILWLMAHVREIGHQIEKQIKLLDYWNNERKRFHSSLFTHFDGSVWPHNDQGPELAIALHPIERVLSSISCSHKSVRKTQVDLSRIGHLILKVILNWFSPRSTVKPDFDNLDCFQKVTIRLLALFPGFVQCDRFFFYFHTCNHFSFR